MQGAINDNIDILNNIFHNSIEGYAFNWISGDISGSDYNNLYTNGSNVGNYKSADYATLGTFQSATGFDDNSVSEILTFASSTDLHIAGIISPSTGITIPTILDDIDGNKRNNPPNIGADEYSPPPLNGTYIVGT